MMKKMLVLALGVLLVVAFCAPVVKAETKFEFTGNYRVRYSLYNNYNLTGNSDDEDKSALFDHRFRWQPSFIVSDCLKLSTRIQAYNSNWGDTTQSGGVGSYSRNPAALNLNRAWMDIKTKYGLFKVGRMYGGSLGLDPLGYVGGMFIDQAHGVFTNVQPFESTSDRDRIVYNLPLGAFTFSAVYEKSHEVDRGNNGPMTPANPIGYEEDADIYAAVGTYKWSTGTANLSAVYKRFRDYDLDVNGSRDDIDMYILAPALIQTFGPFTMHFEFDYMWGTARYDTLSALDDQDLAGWGGYIDGWYNYGPGQVGALFQYVQGTNWDRAGDEAIEGMVGYGADHYPFLMAADIIATHDLTDGSALADGGSDQNYWAFGLQANHNLTEVLMLHAALGYFQLVNVPDTYAGATEDIDKNLGMEFDLGLNWKIMEGLDFTSMVGYYWGGSAFEYGNPTTDVGNAYAWRNMLWMSF